MDWIKIVIGAAIGAVVTVIVTAWLTGFTTAEPRPDVRMSWVPLPKISLSVDQRIAMPKLNGAFGAVTGIEQISKIADALGYRTRAFDIQISNSTDHRTKPLEVLGDQTKFSAATTTTAGKDTTTLFQDNDDIKLPPLGPGDSVHLFLISGAYTEVPYKVLVGDVAVTPTIATITENPHATIDLVGEGLLGLSAIFFVVVAGLSIWAYRNRNNMELLTKMTGASDLARSAKLIDYVRTNAADKLPAELRKPPE